MSTYILEKTLGLTALSVMDDCYKFGLTNGCAIDCPQLMRGECDLKDDENKELYQEYLMEKQPNK